MSWPASMLAWVRRWLGVGEEDPVTDDQVYQASRRRHHAAIPDADAVRAIKAELRRRRRNQRHPNTPEDQIMDQETRELLSRLAESAGIDPADLLPNSWKQFLALPADRQAAFRKSNPEGVRELERAFYARINAGARPA